MGEITINRENQIAVLCSLMSPYNIHLSLAVTLNEGKILSDFRADYLKKIMWYTEECLDLHRKLENKLIRANQLRQMYRDMGEFVLRGYIYDENDPRDEYEIVLYDEPGLNIVGRKWMVSSDDWKEICECIKQLLNNIDIHLHNTILGIEDKMLNPKSITKPIKEDELPLNKKQTAHFIALFNGLNGIAPFKQLNNSTLGPIIGDMTIYDGEQVRQKLSEPLTGKDIMKIKEFLQKLISKLD